MRLVIGPRDELAAERGQERDVKAKAHLGSCCRLTSSVDHRHVSSVAPYQQNLHLKFNC